MAQIRASYGDDILLEEKLAILAKTIFIQQTFLLFGFHIIPESNENNNLVQSNCISVIVNKTQFEFRWEERDVLITLSIAHSVPKQTWQTVLAGS